MNANVPMIDLEATGKNIERLRKVQGLSVKGMQDVFGFTNPQSIYRWQSGQSLPSIDNFVILASMLKSTIDEILVLKGDFEERGK